MKVAATNAEQLHEGGRRLDASYHASGGVKALRFIRQWAGQPAQPAEAMTRMLRERGQMAYDTRRLESLEEVCVPGGIFIPSRFKRIFVDDPEHGAPYLTGGSIMQADPLAGAKLLSYRFTQNMDELALRERMILVTCSGTIGNAVYVNANFEGAVGSPDLLRIVADPEKIPPGYLYAFLSSPLGRALIEQKTYGAVVPHIEAHHVTDLPIPRLNPLTEERIQQSIEQAAALRVEANILLAEAQGRLLELSKMPRLTNKQALTKGCWCFTVPHNHYGKFTFTAWTYNPITQAVTTRILERQHARLGELVKPDGITRGNRFSRLEADPVVGVMLLSQAHVFQERPQGRWISKRSVIDYSDYIVPDGGILVAAQGTMGDNELFGHCQFSHRNFENCMITEHILRVIPDRNRVNPGYLFAFLSSEYGFNLFRSTACGTKLLGFIPGLVEQIPIPMVVRKIQDEIGAMVYRAYDNRADALLLEDEAQALLAKGLAIQEPVIESVRDVPCP